MYSAIIGDRELNILTLNNTILYKDVLFLKTSFKTKQSISGLNVKKILQ